MMVRRRRKRRKRRTKGETKSFSFRFVMICNDFSLVETIKKYQRKENNNDKNNVLIKGECAMSLRHNFPRAVSAATLRETKRNRSRLFACLNVMNSKLIAKRVVCDGVGSV